MSNSGSSAGSSARLLEKGPDVIDFALDVAMANLHIHEEEHVVGVSQVAVMLNRVVWHARSPRAIGHWRGLSDGCDIIKRGYDCMFGIKISVRLCLPLKPG